MIDSHHHLWRYSTEEYPWIPTGSALAQDHLLPELESAAAAAGIDGTIAVQARQSLEESDWLLDLTDHTELIAGVVGWVPLVDDSVSEPLSRLAAHEKFVGVRHVLQDEPDAYFLRDDLHRGLALLPDLDLRYDLLIHQRQLAVALEFVDRQPDLGIIIDHIAKPEIRNGKIDPTWKSGMTELANRGNILGVKISGMVTEVRDDEIEGDTLRAYFEETLGIFGADRLLYGSDWPVCLLRIESHREWADKVRQFTSNLSDDESHAILHDNAVRIYGI